MSWIEAGLMLFAGTLFGLWLGAFVPFVRRLQRRTRQRRAVLHAIELGARCFWDPASDPSRDVCGWCGRSVADHIAKRETGT